MAITVFDAVGKFSADTSQLDQFIVKLEQGLTSASDKAAASTRALKEAQDEFRSSIKAVSAEGGNTAENMSRLAEAEKNLALAAAAAKQEHSNLKQSLGDASDGAGKANYSMMEARHSVMLLGEEFGVHIPRAVTTLIASMGPLGGLLAAAFPIVGAIALIAVIGKVIEQHDKYQQALRKAAQDAENLKIKEEDRTASLEIANLRLEDQIKKLEGRPATNQLAIALREVQTKADELATSFAADFQKMDKDVGDLNGLIQKFSDYAANALIAWNALASGDTATFERAKQGLSIRGEETEAVQKVFEAEKALDKARLASHDAATKDAASQQVALGQQAIAAGNLQKAYDSLADAVTKVDPNNHELIAKLRNSALSAQSDWKDLEQEIKQVGLAAKETSDIQSRETAKRAEEMDKIKAVGAEKMGILDAQAIQQAGEQAFAAEQAAIKKIVDADVAGGQDRLQAEIDMLPRMEAAEEALNTAKMNALKAAHEARITLLEAEKTDILKYEKGDEQQKALAENLNKQQEENRKFELDRQKLASDGETKLTAISEKGAQDRIALQKAMQKAVEELAKAQDQLLISQTQLGEAETSRSYKVQEQAITRLAQFHVITEEQKRDKLRALYAQEERDAIGILEDQLSKQKAAMDEAQHKLTAAQGNPFFTEAQVLDLRKKLAEAESAYTKTQTQITKTEEKFDKERLAQQKDSIAASIAALNAYESVELQASQAKLQAIELEIRLAQARGQDTSALSAQRTALLVTVAAEHQQETAKKQALILDLQLQQARLTAIKDEIALAKAEGQDTSALKTQEKEIQHLITLLQKQVQQLTKVKGAIDSFGKGSHATWDGFVHDLANGVNGLENMKAIGIEAFDSLAAGMQSAIASAIMGQESFGAALEKATASALSQIGAEAIVKAIFYTAEGLAALAMPFGAGSYSASMYFAAAAEMGIIGAAAAAAGHAMAGASGSSSSSSSTSSPKLTVAETAQPAPSSGPNVTTSLATGGVASNPMLVQIGDAEGGGAAKEAVLPLENQRALDIIAMAIVPALIRAMSSSGSDKSEPLFLPRMSSGGIAMSPLLAWVGDSESGGSQKEGILPLENQGMMEMVAEALVPGISKALASVAAAAPRSVLASPSLISPSTLASVGTIVERELRIERTESTVSRSGFSQHDAQQIASAFAKAMDGKTPLSGKIEVQIQSDIDQVVKKINHNVSTGRSRLVASTALRTIKRT